MLKTPTPSGNSKPGRSTPARWARAVSPLLLALTLAAAGCHSVYHRSQRLMTADPCAELDLRIGEAQRAEALARSAGFKVRDALKSGPADGALVFHLDRLEMMALDLGRRAVSVKEAATRCSTTAPGAAPAATFQHRSESLVAWVRQARAGEVMATLTALEELLQAEPGR